ncbi:MAG TPA: type II toxin-antitoxin system PemK/MazF family toxin [Xanthobacteraceae bacterium]|nr:type II toxin-antitoxin system PemK/MazF family toxin [Xanthobacteraceae bacterium]
MPLPVPEAGLVIGYSYLWHSEFQRGQEEGLKDRPCVVVVASRRAGDQTIVTVVPVTHAPPPSVADAAIELHPATKARLGLDGARSWVVVSEINRFVWPGTDLRPVSRNEPDRFAYGRLPPATFNQIAERLVACVKAKRLKSVHRTE